MIKNSFKMILCSLLLLPAVLSVYSADVALVVGSNIDSFNQAASAIQKVISSGGYGSGDHMIGR